MAIVNILAEKFDFIGLQCWLKLLCVNYQIAPWDFVSIVAYYFSLRLISFPKSPLLPAPSLHTFVVHSLFLYLGVCNFQICAVIITHHYGSSWDMHEEPASVTREEEEKERGGGGVRETTEEGEKKMWQLRLSEWVVSAEGAGPGVGCAVLYSLSSLIKKCQSDYMWTTSKLVSPPKKVLKESKEVCCFYLATANPHPRPSAYPPLTSLHHLPTINCLCFSPWLWMRATQCICSEC